MVYRVIPNTSVDPWGDVVDIARNHLFHMGYYAEGERSGVVEVPGRAQAGASVRPHRHPAARHRPAQALLQSLQAGNPALYRLLHDDIRKGIDSRYEAPDTDSSSISD